MKKEKSIFVEYFGEYPLIKILDFLVEGAGFDYSMAEIAKGSEVGWSAFSRIWKELNEKGIIVKTRQIGNAKLYTLNTKNPFVKLLINLDKSLVKLELNKVHKKIIVPA